MLKLYRISDFLKDIFLITRCAACEKQTESGGICKDCCKVLDVAALSEDAYGFDTEGYTVKGRAVFSYEYQQVQRLVMYMKVNADNRVSRYLAAFLAGKIRALGIDTDVTVTFVPRSTEGLRENGFDQSQLLAAAAADILPFAKCRRLLKRKGKSTAQKRLSGKDRKENVKGKFCAVKTAASPKNIVIVDDMFTTGSSIKECAGVLKKAYPDAEIFCVTVAKTPEKLRLTDIIERKYTDGDKKETHQNC